MQVQLAHEEDRSARTPVEGEGTVRVLRSADEVEGIRAFWSSCPGTLDSDIDVFLPAQESATRGLRFRILVLYRGGEPVALMAARIDRTRFGFRFGWSSLLKPLVNVLTIRGGVRGDQSPDSCRLLVRGVMTCLRNGEADVALLAHVAADSALFSCVKREPGLLYRDYVTPLRQHRMRKLPGSVEQLYLEFSSHERKRFRQIAKKLSAEFSGNVRVERLGTSSDLDRTLAVVEGIAAKTWQRSMDSGFSLSLSDTFRSQAEKGWLRIYVLFLADKPCAFWIGDVYRQTFYSEFTGYDGDYGAHSLGTYLLSYIMEELCSEGVGAIDFGSSDEEYKKRFGNLTWSEGDVYVFAPSLMGLTLSAMKATGALLHESTRALLKRTNLFQRAKRVWRKVSVKRAKTA